VRIVVFLVVLVAVMGSAQAATARAVIGAVIVADTAKFIFNAEDGATTFKTGHSQALSVETNKGSQFANTSLDGTLILGKTDVTISFE